MTFKSIKIQQKVFVFHWGMVPALFVLKETVSKYACDTAVPLNPLFIRQQLHQGQEQGYIVCVTHAAVFWNQSTCLTLAAVFWNRSTFERIRLKNLRQINRIRILPTLDRILLKSWKTGSESRTPAWGSDYLQQHIPRAKMFQTQVQITRTSRIWTTRCTVLQYVCNTVCIMYITIPGIKRERERERSQNIL